MSDQTVRRRVERLLQGERRPDDLTRIFMHMRDRSDGRESVQEIGDFVAHQNDRIKGLVTRSSRRRFKELQFQLEYILDGEMKSESLPQGVKDFLLYNVENLDNSYFKKGSISRSNAYHLVQSINKKLKLLDNGRWSAYDTQSGSWLITDEEIALFNKLLHVLVIAPVFTGEQLCQDIKGALKINALLRKGEMKAFNDAFAFIQLYAVSVMNGSTIVLQDGSKATLVASTDPRVNETVSVLIEMTLPFSGNRSIKFAPCMFTTNCKHTEHCQDELLAQDRPRNLPLDVKEDGRLGRVVN
jgi:hypothetical protein